MGTKLGRIDKNTGNQYLVFRTSLAEEGVVTSMKISHSGHKADFSSPMSTFLLHCLNAVNYLHGFKILLIGLTLVCSLSSRDFLEARIFYLDALWTNDNGLVNHVEE